MEKQNSTFIFAQNKKHMTEYETQVLSKLTDLKVSIDSMTTTLSGKVDEVNTNIDTNTGQIIQVLGDKLDAIKLSVEGNTSGINSELQKVLQSLSADLKKVLDALKLHGGLFGDIKDIATSIKGTGEEILGNAELSEHSLNDINMKQDKWGTAYNMHHIEPFPESIRADI